MRWVAHAMAYQHALWTAQVASYGLSGIRPADFIIMRATRYTEFGERLRLETRALNAPIHVIFQETLIVYSHRLVRIL